MQGRLIGHPPAPEKAAALPQTCAAAQNFQAICTLQFHGNAPEVRILLGITDDDLLTVLRRRRQSAGPAADDCCPTVPKKVFHVRGVNRLKRILPEHALVDGYAVNVLDAAACEAIHLRQCRCIVCNRRTAGIQRRLKHGADVAPQTRVRFDVNGVCSAAQRLLHKSQADIVGLLRCLVANLRINDCNICMEDFLRHGSSVHSRHPNGNTALANCTPVSSAPVKSSAITVSRAISSSYVFHFVTSRFTSFVHFTASFLPASLGFV